jgi:thymidylate kinase
MTRKERKAAVAERRKQLKLKWLEEVRADILDVSFRVAIDRLGKRVASEIEREPQRTEEILQAFREFLKHFNDSTNTVQKEHDVS